MSFVIRPIREEDTNDINELRIMEGVRENIYAIPSERRSRAENMYKNLTQNDHLFVAEVIEENRPKVVGMIGMRVETTYKIRHIGSIGLMVRGDYSSRGIGTALLEEVINLADNFLMLKRLELEVFEENTRAKKLYEKMGFVVEGKKKYGAIRNGKYANEYIMARYNEKI